MLPNYARILIAPHVLYVAFAVGFEILMGVWLSPLIGGVLILILLLAGLVAVYAMLFWGWRYHRDNKVADFFADILTYIIDAVWA